MEEIRPGDVVWFPPGEKHWHGATPTTPLTHLASQERQDGKTVEWLEKVSDEPTADLLTQRMQIHEKTAWMLRSLLAA